MIVGDTVLVKGITQKGKTRIAEHGEFWEIINKLDWVSCINAPGVFLKSHKTGHMRWTGIENGIGDFDIEVM